MAGKKLDKSNSDDNIKYNALVAKLGFSNDDVARLCDAPESMVVKWETGKASPDRKVIETLEALATLQDKPEGKKIIDYLCDLPVNFDGFISGGTKFYGGSGIGGFILNLAKGIISISTAIGIISKYISKKK